MNILSNCHNSDELIGEKEIFSNKMIVFYSLPFAFCDSYIYLKSRIPNILGILPPSQLITMIMMAYGIKSGALSHPDASTPKSEFFALK